MAESGEELGMARQATAALREETRRWHDTARNTALSHALNPMDAWMAAARMVPLLGLTAAPDCRPPGYAQRRKKPNPPTLRASEPAISWGELRSNVPALQGS